MTTKNLIKKQHVFTCFCLQHFCVGPHYPDLPEILTKNALKINMAPKNKKREKIKVIYFCFLLSKCGTVQQKSSSFIKIN